MKKNIAHPVRSLKLGEWPQADRLAWKAACRPSLRLIRGGAAAHLKTVTQSDLVKRYGLFLNFVDRLGSLDRSAPACSFVTPNIVRQYLAELQVRVSSVTCYGNIYKLRRVAEILAPDRDFAWLRELENDLCLVMRPASKFDRVIDSDRLVTAGLSLMIEAEEATGCTYLQRARSYRNGLMVALLATAPIRLKNFTDLSLGRTFIRVKNRWWICLPAQDTKSGRADERPVAEFLNEYLDRYLEIYRPLLGASGPKLWISPQGGSLSYNACERIITDTTRQTIGVSVSPHLFRSCAASTAALYAGDDPHLASALLQHTDPTVTEKHYNRARASTFASAFGALIENLLPRLR